MDMGQEKGEIINEIVLDLKSNEFIDPISKLVTTPHNWLMIHFRHQLISYMQHCLLSMLAIIKLQRLYSRKIIGEIAKRTQ